MSINTSQVRTRDIPVGFKPDWKPRSGTRAGSTPPADAGGAGAVAGGAGAGAGGAGGGAGGAVPSAIAFC